MLIGGHRYPLYVHSYLFYGQNEVDRRIKRLLVEDSSSSSSSRPISHPCMLRGDTVSDEKLGRTFTGSGNPSGCIGLLNRLVHKAEPSKCYPKPCGIGVFYQPTIDEDTTFYATGSFRYAIDAIGAINEESVFVPRVGFDKAFEFCTKHIDEAVSPTANDKVRKHVRARCQMSLYTATLLTRGYGFANDSQQIRVVDKINDQPLEWTLGAILYEDELAAINACGIAPHTAEVRGSATHLTTFTAAISTVLLWTSSLFLLSTLQLTTHL